MASDDFSPARLGSIIDMRHPLALPATRMYPDFDTVPVEFLFPRHKNFYPDSHSAG